MPESTHMLVWVMSDRAIPRSLRMMEGFGIHTFRLVDQAGKSTFVKFHGRRTIGSASVLWDEEVKINGADPDFHRRDLWSAIANGNFPEWELAIQSFDEEKANSLGFDVLDPTKLVPSQRLTTVGFPMSWPSLLNCYCIQRFSSDGRSCRYSLRAAGRI
jgi:catalase